MGLQIRHPGLDKPILIPFRPREKLDAETILRHIEEVLQSNKEFSIDARMSWQVTRVGIPCGTAPKRKMTSNFEDWLNNKTKGHGGSVIRIRNSDELCLARALVTAKCHIQQADSEEG